MEYLNHDFSLHEDEYYFRWECNCGLSIYFFKSRIVGVKKLPYVEAVYLSNNKDFDSIRFFQYSNIQHLLRRINFYDYEEILVSKIMDE